MKTILIKKGYGDYSSVRNNVDKSLDTCYEIFWIF